MVGATAALRVAEDAPDFVASILRETGLDISPISGEEEARLSALGLLSNNDKRVGIGADLGGASLELMRIEPGLKQMEPLCKASRSHWVLLTPLAETSLI